MAIIRSFLTIILIFAFCSTINADEIHLKDGRIIKASSCWKENNTYYYVKYGATVAFPEEKVLKVVHSVKTENNAVAANPDKNFPKNTVKQGPQSLKVCYDECDNAKLICKNENQKDPKDCSIDERVCILDCDIELKIGQFYNLPDILRWSEKIDALKNVLDKSKKMWAKISNWTDEEWQSDFNSKDTKSNIIIVRRSTFKNWKEYKDYTLNLYEGMLEKRQKSFENKSVLDLNEVDLSKFTKEAKTERKKRIEDVKVSVATHYINCIYDKANKEPNLDTGGWSSCRNRYQMENTLPGLIRQDIELQNTENAFFEELGIDLEKEAERKIAQN